ncbi:hypothetical protein ABFT80_14000 [Mesorhizobium sp. SB112]|uniref:hypothetical protein n=1 Tax=Mesorhizobium sp. SB112 TaxID=3151853 RepID=UPI003264E017
MGTIVTATDAVNRVEQIVDALDMRGSVWSKPPFDGTNYDHALPVFEALYRWAARSNFQSGAQQSAKREIERAAVETWASSPVAAQLFIGQIAMIQSIPAYAHLPISEWPIDRLVEEWIRIKRVIAILNEIRWYLGVGGTANTLGSKAGGRVIANAGVASQIGAANAARAATLLRVSGAVGLGITVLSGVGLTIAIGRCNATAQEIEEEIETVRIPKGEISQAKWDAVELRIVREAG